MNTRAFQITVQQRMCYKLAFLTGNRVGIPLKDLNYELTRIANRVLIEAGLNHALWSRVYRNRVFVYHIETRRAVLELGVDSESTGRFDQNGDLLYKGFSLVLGGGIHNNYVVDDLVKLTTARPLKQRSFSHG